MPKQVGDARLGEKLREAIRMRGVSQADVARAFGVRPSTVSSDWLKFGRIAKRHFPRLVEYFELPYEWWFGQAHAQSTLFAYRRDNFRSIIGETFTGARALAAQDLALRDAAEVASYENDKPIDSELARRTEAVAGKPVGWLDVPHGGELSRTLDARVSALPPPLRDYLMGELELCEAVAGRVVTEFMKPPTRKNVREFQNYLRSIADEAPKRRAG